MFWKRDLNPLKGKGSQINIQRKTETKYQKIPVKHFLFVCEWKVNAMLIISYAKHLHYQGTKLRSRQSNIFNASFSKVQLYIEKEQV